MRALIVLLMALAVFASAHAKEAVSMAEDPVIEQRLLVISEEMRCLVCQNESLAGSRSELANDLRAQIRQQIKLGKTDDEIREYMVSRYGDFVLYRPPVKATTILLWVGPFLILAGAVAVLFQHLRANARRPDDEEATT
ncbi:cytochrome c-type biogenesis protein [Ramlibacter albus]|uniref:Cytochrome c-type biogenesis protein n=1 Tax=Ramlibacter albus TaxID=2079448 RepID=A0A923S1N3_9BURK|nr:cytochrome c-type biogenesis protein [Ramlibacter albus]MBC5764466.1 cytochrome c-type biogenesis protein CcmH [Ramlibacter albus]